jgi:hypothetical protein
MNELDTQLIKLLNDFGGEASLFLITHQDSPWAKFGDSKTVEAMVKALVATGNLAFNEEDGTVSVT